MGVITLDVNKRLSDKERNLANYLAQQEINDCEEFFSLCKEQFSLSYLFSSLDIDTIKKAVLYNIYIKYFDTTDGSLKDEYVVPIIEKYSKQMDLSEIEEDEEDD